MVVRSRRYAARGVAAVLALLLPVAAVPALHGLWHSTHIFCGTRARFDEVISFAGSSIGKSWGDSPRCFLAANPSDGTRDRFVQIISFARSGVGKSWWEGQKMEKLCQGLQTAKKDFDQEPMIMFVGAFSCGKSTMINTLVGEEICATGRHPTTNDLNFIHWNGLFLVDSTGFGNWKKPEHQEKAFEAARRSNIAVVVLSAVQALTESEIPILKQLLKSQSKIVVAINYWNYLETEKDQSEVMTHVQRCLEEIMPGPSVEVFPINAKNGSDCGMQTLSEFLLSTDLSDQKIVSANAAMRNAAQQMLDMCAAHETKEKQTHEKKVQGLDREIASLEKEVTHSDDKLKNEETHLQAAREKKEELAREHDKRWKEVARSALVGATVGATGFEAGPHVGAATMALGAITCMIYANPTACMQLSEQIKEMNMHITKLQGKIIECEETLAYFKNEVTKQKVEKMQAKESYKTKMTDLESDEKKLFEFRRTSSMSFF